MLALETRQASSRHQIDFLVGPRVGFVAAGVGAVSFLITEFMHFLLVPDLGRRWERVLAESVSAAAVGLLTVMLLRAIQRHRAVTLLRLQVISEMNQHVRTALLEISATTGSIENQQCLHTITENVDRIEWALREILLRPLPVCDDRRPARDHSRAAEQDSR